jgi:ring-1,2-phenylacetyl-CoA epoxidase subunit PaaC
MEMTERHVMGLIELLYKMADDQLIIGHRNSEWTGLGPILEEDIAFSSMAQDKIGQSLALFELLHELGEQDPDTVAFTRNAEQFHCCQLVEAPIGEFNFSIVRQYLFDQAEALRFEMLMASVYEPLAMVSRKFRGEIKYHVMHGKTWIKQLSEGNEESHQRMQEALNEVWPLALGIFEEGDYEKEISEVNIFAGEATLKSRWMETVVPFLESCGLHIPQADAVMGGRHGQHSPYLQPLLDEMCEVFRIDPSAEW